MALSRRTAGFLAGAAVLVSIAGAPAVGAGEGPPGAAPVDLEALLRNLGEKAKVYADVALRFICIESVHSSSTPDAERRYDYMYVGAQQQRYLPYRQKHTGRPGRGAEETNLNVGFPDSYSWTLMFLPERQHLFRFKYAGQEWFSLRLCHILEFTASLPFTTGQTIYEWSGKIWVDAENYNFLRVEAEPGGQEERLKLELKGYRQAPRFLVFPMARRPRGGQYNITFLNDFERLSLPDQAEYRLFSLDLDGSRELENVMTLRYNGYQFFDVNVKDKFLK